MTLALAEPGAGERGGGSATGESNAQTIAAPKLTLEPGSGSTQGESVDLQEINRKLSNPVSDVWALFTEFDLFFSGGAMQTGSENNFGQHAQIRLNIIPVIPSLIKSPVFGGN